MTTVIALDLEGTLISNAVSQFPRPDLREFLDFCRDHFTQVCLYTAVREELCREIIIGLANEGLVPAWFTSIPIVAWDRQFKDLENIPGVNPADCLLVDDNPDYVLDSQRGQWIPIAKFESPYPNTDRELARVQEVLLARLHLS